MGAPFPLTLPWLRVAWKYYGITEIKGPKHHPTIIGWLRTLKAWYLNDEDPWCGVFPAIVFHELGVEIPKLYMRAKEWAKWGKSLHGPVFGCIGVMDRQGGGHVTFIVGKTKDGYLVGYGGNQRDSVRLSKFNQARFTAFRYPAMATAPLIYNLPLLEVDDNVSVNEA